MKNERNLPGVEGKKRGHSKGRPTMGLISFADRKKKRGQGNLNKIKKSTKKIF